jgi:hypothetical protein
LTSVAAAGSDERPETTLLDPDDPACESREPRVEVDGNFEPPEAAEPVEAPFSALSLPSEDPALAGSSSSAASEPAPALDG